MLDGRQSSQFPFKDLCPRTPDRDFLNKKLPEWILLEQLVADLEKVGDYRRGHAHFLGSSKNEKYEIPLVALSFGSPDPTAPVLGLFGGVHGLERIGSQVVLSLLKSFSELMLWDELIQQALKKVRFVFFPMINPIGMMEHRRSNPRGVDLMRNAPIDAIEKPTWMVGGQRVSPKIPWFRGDAGKMEVESQALYNFCQEQFFQSRAVITVDCHSGFGKQDQLWFPYAKTLKPFPHLPEMFSLAEHFERTYPHHFYKIEPQALNYTTHGDLWDHIYDQYRVQNPGVFIPLCLEMGSWMWVRKNPLQLFSSLGAFNPIKPHRHKRILRRHMTLFDFLVRSTLSNANWSDLNPEQRNKFSERALSLWYKK